MTTTDPDDMPADPQRATLLILAARPPDQTMWSYPTMRVRAMHLSVVNDAVRQAAALLRKDSIDDARVQAHLSEWRWLVNNAAPETEIELKHPERGDVLAVYMVARALVPACSAATASDDDDSDDDDDDSDGAGQ